MYIRSVSGKLIRINDIENTKLPGEQNNYKSTAKEFYGKDRHPKPKQDKVYSISSIQKILETKYNCKLVNITGYKGNRFVGYNTYRVLDQHGNKVMDGSLHDIGEWIEERG